MLRNQQLLVVAAVLAVAGIATLLIATTSGNKRTADLELVRVPRRRMAMRARGQMLWGTETYPYWEREHTGDPEMFAEEYIDLCIRKLYPEVGCPGSWDSSYWSPIHDEYDNDHPELDIWPPE
ncbi:hypothetical protein GUITHDRAFT_162508 [Guillardia theta CCMP2712]|uniref:Uncharacterized protein n=1 Tax=Guillardia theta (strain CCMP2712) TaxID=905079 RepID=L1JI61_GUITC|nr:hypothetical protein GUITHDRAFT_162508 [Guillardia theta CCMP2712]EKX48012.1 hypothetical protein GUITHDRAFT_162508 [Guillardia theta CCMP2712]|eukprot:XP_005834992.1 hypothetical protein GUITHDRAFT_162508 [Guillardia theta CCMP2712]